VVHVEKDKKPEVFWYLIEADEKLNSTVYFLSTWRLILDNQPVFTVKNAVRSVNCIQYIFLLGYSSLNPKTKPSTSRLRKITAVNFLILHKKIAYKRKHPGVSHKDLEL
jgi:hypothetical protein